MPKKTRAQGTAARTKPPGNGAGASGRNLFEQLDEAFRRPGYPIDAKRVFELMNEIQQAYGDDKKAVSGKDLLLVNRITELANDAAAAMDSLWAVWIDLVRCLVLINITLWGMSGEKGPPPLPKLPQPWPPPPKSRKR
jgi:hypothetical protein